MVHFTHRRRFYALDQRDFQKTWLRLTTPTHTTPSSPVGTPTGDSDKDIDSQPPLATHAVNDIKEAIQPTLTSFWAAFTPDLDEADKPDEPQLPLPLELLNELRLHTAPWGVDDWENDDDDDDEPPADIDEDRFQDENLPISPPPTPPPEEDLGHIPSGAPLPLRIAKDQIHLLDPVMHKINQDAHPADPRVPTIPPFRPGGGDSDWCWNLLRKGASLPRPFGAPNVFRATRPSPVTDRIIQSWIDSDLLRPTNDLVSAFPLFAVPKPDGTVRPIIDYSSWTDYFVTPRFSLLDAGAALKDILPHSKLIKVDLKSGFHQLKIDPATYRFNGIYYNGTKYHLTRLPMGHALAPGIFQRFALCVLRHVHAILGVKGIAYLDDWLFFSHNEEDLNRTVDFLEHLGITVNRTKSHLTPTKTLIYLGFEVNTARHTIKVTLQAYDRLRHLLRYVKRGSRKDRQRIAGYATWLLFNLRWPTFLSTDILRGDPSWLLQAMSDFSFLAPRHLLDALLQITVYSDATPHSLAGICPQLNTSWATMVYQPMEINVAETLAAILTIAWISDESADTHIILYTDNASAFSALRSGRGRVFRYYDLRRAYLSMLHGLRSKPSKCGLLQE